MSNTLKLSNNVKLSKDNVESDRAIVYKVISSASYSTGWNKITVDLGSDYYSKALISTSLVNTSPNDHVAQYFVCGSKGISDSNCYVFIYNNYSSKLTTALQIAFELKL